MRRKKGREAWRRRNRKKSDAMAAGGEKRCLRRREVVLRNLSERKREGQKLLMADLKRMTEKTIDTGAGNKSDEKADQSENGKHAAGGKVAKRAAAERRVTEKAGKIR